MRELNLNGYIDDERLFGDEITPETLHDQLFDTDYPDDVHILLNSYGGSCNAAVRMFDEIRAYPKSVKITISGTAASAATIVAMAADRLEMTPGSLFMIHDPSTVAYGNERDLQEAMDLLRVCKESILNMYGTRARVSREDTSAMMSETTWMDANEAYEKGFVDAIAEPPEKLPDTTDITAAKAHVQAWFDRKLPRISLKKEPTEVSEMAKPTLPQPTEVPKPTDKIPVTETDTRLEHLRY